VFRSARHIYVQAIDDDAGLTVAAASSLDQGFNLPKDKGKIPKAKVVGAMIAKRLMDKDYKQVIFDRNGFLYHGRVRALAEAAREAGLKF